ncbi:hypothetical protein IDJ75_10700 [Mucilaginibacter rigui]|uniref:Uncharacterized protein n=1 Tax=Mucilaginibacter rigui TaxID=534635 RepID=A0ABR7X587_9SPHI|nr:hypothetical protein [Mucilaginibacter rigui]MBD1385748.1 hypothetical protein [Mucilaginibacter rigui]
MNGTIAQLVSLATYGNAYLKHQISSDELNLYCSTFIYCKKIEFVNIEKGTGGLPDKESTIANNPGEWYRYLQTEGCTSLKLYYEHSADQSMFSDHKTSGFVGGGGVWLIESAHKKGYFKYWFAKWEVTDTKAPDNRIWSITYYAVLTADKSRIKQSPPLAVVKKELSNTLKTALDFSLNNDTGGFSTAFENAISNIDSPNPKVEYYKDLIPPDGFSLEQQQLLFSAASSWVFGGMGSWNDLGFGDEQTQAEYNDISKTLYDDIIAAIVTAINAN